MYCPQCSQEQVAEEMRFCSRCGFPLAVVSQLVTGGGVLAGFDEDGKRKFSRRQRGVRKGLLMLLIAALLVPIVGGMTRIDEGFLVLFLPVLMVFVYGVARMLYAYLLEQGAAASAKPQQLNATNRVSLPSSRESLPITQWKRPANTSEMAQPPSVTDHTTKLLNDE